MTSRLSQTSTVIYKETLKLNQSMELPDERLQKRKQQ